MPRALLIKKANTRNIKHVVEMYGNSQIRKDGRRNNLIMTHLETSRKDTMFLRFIAIILILNSHLDLYYPIAYIGTGGAIGNSLFFMLSSFGLLLSERNKANGLSTYAEKRFIRIFPPVWIVLIVVVLPIVIYTNAIAEYDLLSFIGYFFYPPFWFIQGLMCYYCLGYFLIKRYTDKKIISLGILILLIYLYLYTAYIDLSVFSIEKSPIDFLFYFGIFIFGIFIASRNDNIKYNGISDVLIFILLLMAIYFHKYLMLNGILPRLQFIQQALIFPLIFQLLRISRSPLVVSQIMNFPILSHIIRWMSASTLEIYLVHTAMARLKIYNVSDFPINILVFLISTFIIVCIINQLTHLFKKVVSRQLLLYEGVR
jgi:peptidoglycan/LPS O-acetylase OafA/YrhL